MLPYAVTKQRALSVTCPLRSRRTSLSRVCVLPFFLRSFIIHDTSSIYCIGLSKCFRTDCIITVLRDFLKLRCLYTVQIVKRRKKEKGHAVKVCLISVHDVVYKVYKPFCPVNIISFHDLMSVALNLR